MGRSVLVIDDDEAIRHVVAAVLQDEGYSVQVAADGPSGLALAEEDWPALVVLDVHMPGMGGPEVVSALAQRRGDRPMPRVIVMTASGSAERHAAEMRADAYLPKPFALEDLLRAVRDRLGPP